MLNFSELGKLSDNDRENVHNLNVLLDICRKYNDKFTDEERKVLGICIGCLIGLFESEMMQEALTALVVDKFMEQVKES